MAEPAVYVAFFILAAVTLGGAIAVVTARNILHSALFLALVFVSVAGLYVLLEAPFLAAVQILIYVGAIIVLILFALMLTRRITGERIRQTNAQAIPAALAALALLAVLGGLVATFAWRVSTESPPPNTVPLLGESLMRTYMLPFEVAGVVLLVALVGAIILAKER